MREGRGLLWVQGVGETSVVLAGASVAWLGCSEWQALGGPSLRSPFFLLHALVPTGAQGAHIRLM